MSLAFQLERSHALSLADVNTPFFPRIVMTLSTVVKEKPNDALTFFSLIHNAVSKAFEICVRSTTDSIEQ